MNFAAKLQIIQLLQRRREKLQTDDKRQVIIITRVTF
jgi:hypothetical protein